MKRFFFVFKPSDELFGYYVKVIAPSWQQAKIEFEEQFKYSRISNFYSQEIWEMKERNKIEYCTI